MTHLQEELFELQDIKYRDFHSSLIPGIDKDKVIGIRTPVLRKFAKEYAKSGETEKFMRELLSRNSQEANINYFLKNKAVSRNSQEANTNIPTTHNPQPTTIIKQWQTFHSQ